MELFWLSVFEKELNALVLSLQSFQPCHCSFHAGISVAEEKVMFGVQNNSTFLECLSSSPQTAIHWLVQHSSTAILEEVMGWEAKGKLS